MPDDCKIFEPGILLPWRGVLLAVTSKESASRKMSMASSMASKTTAPEEKPKELWWLWCVPVQHDGSPTSRSVRRGIEYDQYRPRSPRHCLVLPRHLLSNVPIKHIRPLDHHPSVDGQRERAVVAPGGVEHDVLREMRPVTRRKVERATADREAVRHIAH